MGNNQFQILIQAAVDLQKSKNKIDSQIKEIQKQAKIKFNTELDTKTAKQALNQQRKAYIDFWNQTLKQQETVQKQKDQFNSKNLNAIDLEIKKRELVSKQFSNQLKSQMQASMQMEKSQTSLTKLNLNKDYFSSQIDAWVKNNSKAIPDFGNKIDEIKKKIQSADAVELKNLNKQFRTVTKEAEAAGKTGDTLTTKLKKNLEGFGIFMSTATIFMTIFNSIKNMTKNVVELDESLTELKKVTDLSGASLDNFTDKAFELGRQIGRTGKEVIDAVTIFKRAGYTLQESMDLSKASLVMTNVGDGINNVADASSALISVLKGFNFDDSQAMNIVSMINETSNTATIDFQNITEGLRRVSGTLSQTGTSIEQTIGLITGGFGQLRDVEMVSSGLVMISQRLRGIDEDGQAIDGLAPKLQKDFKEIADIDIQDSNGNLRSTYDILSDMARVFPTLTSKQKQFLGEEAAGNVALHVAKVA